MNGRELLEAMSFIDDELLQQSQAPRRKIPRRRWGMLAACACLILLSIFAFRIFQPKGATEGTFEVKTEMAAGAADGATPTAAETPVITESNEERSAEFSDTDAGQSVLQDAAEATLLVLEITENGFLAQILQMEGNELEGATVTVIPEASGFVPEVGTKYKATITRTDPESLTVWISTLKPVQED